MNELRTRIRSINLVRLLTKLFTLLTALVLASTIYFIYSIDVIEDSSWKLILPKGDIHAGDVITVQSIYNKKRNVTGKAERYIECYTEDDILVTYPINEKKADRAPGKGGTGLVLLMPKIVPNLPAKCHIRVSIEYPVLPFRTVPETKSSDDFMLLPEVKEEATGSVQTESGTVSAPQSTVSQVPVSSQSLASNNNTPPQESAQSNSSQPEEPSLLNRVISTVTRLLGGN